MVQLHAFLASALGEGEWLASRNNRFAPGDSLWHPFRGGCDSLRAGLDAVAKRMWKEFGVVYFKVGREFVWMLRISVNIAGNPLEVLPGAVHSVTATKTCLVQALHTTLYTGTLTSRV